MRYVKLFLIWLLALWITAFVVGGIGPAEVVVVTAFFLIAVAVQHRRRASKLDA